jgi:plastocyanin
MKRVAWILVVMAMTIPAAVQSSAAETAPAITYSGPVPLPEKGALFGAFVKLDRHNGLERRQAWEDFEDLVGRDLVVDRQYPNWEEPWPTADDVWSRDQGRTLYISWNASRGGGGPCAYWRDIAAGLHDAEIDAQAAKVIDFVAPMFFTFHHEPTTGPPGGDSCGTPEEFIAAWQHVRARFIAAGVTNVTYAWTMTAWSFLQGSAEMWYPGNDHVDVIAADGYNWFNCRFHPGPWREPQEVFQEFYDFGIAKGKPMAIAEYGTGEDPDVPGKKAQWFANFADTMKQWPEIKAVLYFNVGNGSCDRYIDTSESSLDSFQANGADPYFNPPVSSAAVTVADFSFSPRNVILDQGRPVKWTFNGPSGHSVTDSSGMGLFDSGVRSAGSVYLSYFIGAGAYPYLCSVHPTQMTGTVKVPMVVEPASGDEATEFTVTWSSNFAPTGFVFDTQIRRPGQNWIGWQTNQMMNEVTFIPDAGPGTYQFRARYRNTSNGKATRWSNPASIVVG